jgi:hypothetical protein
MGKIDELDEVRLRGMISALIFSFFSADRSFSALGWGRGVERRHANPFLVMMMVMMMMARLT